MYENYEKILKERGLTNYKVSKDTGIAQSVLSTWKTKGTTPKADKLQILAEYLGVSIDYLLGVQQNVQSEEYYLLANSEIIPYSSTGRPTASLLLPCHYCVSCVQGL